VELFTLLAVFLISAGIGLAAQWRPSSSRPGWPQRAPFLGSGEPAAHAWSRYHVRYYSMALLLIAFEMEMMFMYPWAVVYVAEGMKAMMEMGMFLAILSVGIVYAWREGVFRWQ
jgi:NADH:ubiquinone oxidoreductase subunit 3 (subunit A)